MAIDGVFLNHFVRELKPIIKNKRINKIITINEVDCCFALQNKLKLLLTLNQNQPHLRLTNTDYLNGVHPLGIFLKHHIESGIINDIFQYNNDRILTIIITRNDELGYSREYHLHLELTGRTSNMIITDGEDIILEALKKGFFNDGRIIQTKVKYVYPESNKINPFNNSTDISDNIYEGVSKSLFKEFTYIDSISKVLKRKTQPVIINTNTKSEFYAFDLIHIDGQRQYFDSISEMLDYYFIETINLTTQNNEQKRLDNHINKEITKLKTKLGKQEFELQSAHLNLKYEKIGNILSSNIHLVKPYQKDITVYNFYDDEDITIELNTKIQPKDNINYYFNKYKKAKRAIIAITEAIIKTKTDIQYYQTLLTQSMDIQNNELKEILEEVGIVKSPKKSNKPKLIKYIDKSNNTIYVGKNNVQNNYLTHTLASKDDYFFHVLSYPGSHVILKGELTDEAIILAANIAAYYSKTNGKVSVDYTKVKYVKKIKGQLGSFVTYTNQKSINVTGDIDFINSNTNLDK